MKLFSLSITSQEQAKQARKQIADLSKKFPDYKIQIYSTYMGNELKIKDVEVTEVDANQTPSIWAFLPLFHVIEDFNQVVIAPLGTHIDENLLKSKNASEYQGGVCVVNCDLPLSKSAYYDMLSKMRASNNEETYNAFVENIIRPDAEKNFFYVDVKENAKVTPEYSPDEQPKANVSANVSY